MAEPLNLVTVEQEILSWWKVHKTYEKVKAKNKKNKLFYFLDGPPYTSGKVHIGTAWNKVLKDSVLRYKRMQGFNVYDRAGYDMHGLPIEHKVEAKFGIKNKDEIPKFGVEKFVRECEKFSLENMEAMNKDFMRLGVWMDFEHAYMPITEQSIEAIWWLIAQVHQQERLYAGNRPMTWCPTCASALAKHELDYIELKEPSIYFKFPLEGQQHTYLLIWTTTPWTIPFNEFIMVNPNVNYVWAKVGKDTFVIAKDLADHVFKDLLKESYTIIRECKGAELEALSYAHPYSKELPQQLAMKKKAPKMYTVILSAEFVDTNAGTGLVHAAAGTGVGADYEVAHANKIPAWSEVDDNGAFLPSMGPFAGLRAKFDDAKIIHLFEDRELILAKEKYTHEYPHCWRCHKPAIFKTTTQWFFHVEDLKEKMIHENKTNIAWVPESGFNAFDAWLTNLRDNSITKQRYWGTPLPVWQCTLCKHFEVLSTKKDIEKKSGITLLNLHKPWIDEATYPCSQCKGTMKRIPDVMDVWIDPGCASWISVNYPQEKELFNHLFPADFILEGKDQIRGWFNVLMVCSMLAFKNISFKNVYMHGFVQDALGRKMSKSLGNIISPYEVIDKYGADAFRFYMIGGARAGLDVNYNIEELEAKHRSLNVLWNLHHYLLDLCKLHNVNPTKINLLPGQIGTEEIFMQNLCTISIQKATKHFDNYEIDNVPAVIENLFLSLSRDYIQWKRDAVSEGEDIEVILSTVWNAYLTALTMLAPFCPMITEKIYLNLKQAFGLSLESIHLHQWPVPSKTAVDIELTNTVNLAKEAIGGILAAREKLALGIRWPLKEVFIVPKKKEAITQLQHIEDLIMRQTNVKTIHLVSTFNRLKQSIKPDYKQLGPDFGKKAPMIIAKLSSEDPHTVLDHINKEGYFAFTVDGVPIKIVTKHLIIEQTVESPFVLAQTSQFSIYASGERTDALEAEGYSREIMRRFQQLRKHMGLEKSNSVIAYLQASKEAVDMLKPWKDQIAKRIGAVTFTIGERDPVRQLTHKEEQPIKKENFVFYATKV